MHVLFIADIWIHNADNASDEYSSREKVLDLRQPNTSLQIRNDGLKGRSSLLIGQVGPGGPWGHVDGG